ncbi:MAG: hypothetical protein RR614_03105 [Eubacterium sp.]
MTNQTLNKQYQKLKIVEAKPFPVKISYVITKNLELMEKQLHPYLVEQDKLMQKYCEKDETGNLVNHDGGFKVVDVNAYTKDILELGAIELGDLALRIIKIDEVLNLTNELTPEEMAGLLTIAEEE